MSELSNRLLFALTLTLSILCSQPTRANTFEDGVVAYKHREYAQAFNVWLPLAEQGNAQAQVAIALMYMMSYGVQPDEAQAVRWFRKAADQGDARAQYMLGMMYYRGDGVEPNSEAALRWFERAADKGFVESEMELGRLYRDGYGIPQDLIRSYMWFDVASSHGLLGASEGRDEIADSLTPSQVVVAKRLIRNWKQTHPQ